MVMLFQFLQVNSQQEHYVAIILVGCFSDKIFMHLSEYVKFCVILAVKTTWLLIFKPGSVKFEMFPCCSQERQSKSVYSAV